MRVAGMYSFNRGKQYIKNHYPHLLEEVVEIIGSVSANRHRTKASKEKTMLGKKLYSPLALNKTFKKKFTRLDWAAKRVRCDYPSKYYVKNYKPHAKVAGAFREMDFIKENLGIEVQFGKYAFMVYNVCAKMTIFRNLGFIDAGVEIVPIKKFADQMSTGVSYFEQIAWDLEQRGVADIDIPVLILGIGV